MIDTLQSALRLHQQGQYAQAEKIYRALLLQNPAWPDVLHMLALICREDVKRSAEALDLMQRAQALGANTALFQANFASVHLSNYDPHSALVAADRALQLQPQHFGALQNRALALLELCPDAHALEAIDAALKQRRPAALLRARARVVEQLFPSQYLASLEALAQEFPDPLHYFWLGRAHSRAARPLAAKRALQTALDLASIERAAPNDTRLLLALALADSAMPEAALAMYDQLLSEQANYYQAASNRLIVLQHLAEVSASELLIEHQLWAEKFANFKRRALAPNAVQVSPIRPHGRQAFVGSFDKAKQNLPLRVAFLSPRLAEGPVATFLLPLLRAIDRGRITPILVDLSGVLDDQSARFRACAEMWISAAELDDESLQAALDEVGVDIAIDCAGHAPGNRLQAFAKGLAPFQVAWMDYFCSTGLPAMDALLGDVVLTPLSDGEHFSEQLVLLEYGRLCYAPPADAPALTVRNGGKIRFGNFNRLAKYTLAAARVWCKLLQALPDSEIELRSSALDDPESAEDCYQQFFAPFGIARARVIMKGRTSYLETLQAYQAIDIALDTYPFSGCATSCDALWMGVPVTTRQGETMVSRQSASVLAQLDLSAVSPDRREVSSVSPDRREVSSVSPDRRDLSGLISDSDSEWITNTLALANDRARLVRLRQNLRALMCERVCNAPLHATAFADALEKLWSAARNAIDHGSSQ
jgi:protein O-GlcNAc transferase